MRLLYLTAGAGGMYCGSCLRDNALAAGLMAEGHDVTLLPLYTPTLTDEENVSRPEVFFGGISVYLEQHSALFRRTPKWLDRLWDSAFALRLAARRSIAVDPGQLGELTVSMLKGRAGNQGKELAKLLDWLKGQEPPDAVTLQNSMLIALAAPVKKSLQRPVVCTLQGEDLFLDGLSEPYSAEALRLIRENVAHVDAFIAVSEFYAGFMADYLTIPRAKIHVVPLGINCDGFEPSGRGPGGDFVVGYFGRVAPEKGLHLLADSYRLLRERGVLTNSKLEAAGWLGAENKAYLGGIERRMKEWGLGDEFRYHGALDRQGKIDFMRRLNVFSMPATYAEPKGMSVLEAMAAGVPVVEPRHGSFPEIVERTGGGLLCAPNDAESLAEAVGSLYRNPELAADLGRRGARGVREHYTVQRMAERALEVYGAVV
jgi:glycosyltransferase involved in cell wall biosynthesis